jgi:multidrug efflux system outer membrane protein
MRAIARVALGAALLTGCMVGPDYRRPAIDTPGAYLYEPKESAATADVHWWGQYGDPVLDQLIVDALANNKSVKIAAANVAQAAGVVTTTRAPIFPQVNYQGTATRLRLSQNNTTALPGGVSNPTDFYQVLAGASWEIDLWGRIRRQTEAAQASFLASDEARRGVILSLVGSVAGDYLALRGLDEQLLTALQTQASYAESLRLMELQLKYGRVSDMNVEQARSRYETAAAEIPQIRRQIAQLQDALAILLGRNPGPIPRGKALFELALPPIPAGVPSELLERRPDLLQAEQQLIAANAQIGAAKALYFPTISLTAALGTASTDLGNLFKGPARTWNYAGSIVGPIFTAGAISGQVVQAEAGQEAALLAYEQAIQNAFADVDTALSARQELGEEVAAQERLVKALRAYERLARALFDGGRAPYSTVLQAQEQLFPAELNYAAAQAQLLSSLVDIYKAMGGGWVDAADKLTSAPGPGTEDGAARH